MKAARRNCGGLCAGALRAAMVAGVLGFSVPAGAAVDCDDKPNQSEINRCLREAYQAADRELNEVWKKVKTEVDKRDKELDASLRGWAKALLEAQRGWLVYRQHHCTSVGFEMRGGTGESMLVNGCLARVTRDRVKELKEMLP